MRSNHVLIAPQKLYTTCVPSFTLSTSLDLNVPTKLAMLETDSKVRVSLNPSQTPCFNRFI